MSRFPTAGHLASWAGTCPGSNESAGRIKSTKTPPGNPYLKAALGVAAMSLAQVREHLPGGEVPPYRRAPRTDESASRVERAILIAIWNMAHTGALYDDPGPDFYTRLAPGPGQTPCH
ncbi:MAG: IS110 family transposase [Geodermatophilaceae bacterium]|nr:IS110 family transposase [Geodermatophilaceae bacterium]